MYPLHARNTLEGISKTLTLIYDNGYKSNVFHLCEQVDERLLHFYFENAWSIGCTQKVFHQCELPHVVLGLMLLWKSSHIAYKKRSFSRVYHMVRF